MGSNLNLGNNSKQGARRCGSDVSYESNNLNNVENSNDLGCDERYAVKIEFGQ